MLTVIPVVSLPPLDLFTSLKIRIVSLITFDAAVEATLYIPRIILFRFLRSCAPGVVPWTNLAILSDCMPEVFKHYNALIGDHFRRS